MKKQRKAHTSWTKREWERIDAILKMIDGASQPTSWRDIDEFILKQTTQYFDFDYGIISRVDHLSQTIESASFKSRTKFVNPGQWRHLAKYKLSDKDILAYIVRKPVAVVINGPADVKKWKAHLNKEIFDRFHHQNLVRMWVPFVFQESINPKGPKQIDVLGVIEAGYHIGKKRSINRHQQALFKLFIRSCANSLQRVTLLEQQKTLAGIAERSERQVDADLVLKKLLEECVKVVQGDSGDITFLTHYDSKLRFFVGGDSSRVPIIYKIPHAKFRHLMRELETSKSGETGIVGKVAATGQYKWSNDVKRDEDYIEEFPEVQSELAVPLRYEGKVIGVLNINSNQKNWFSDRKARIVQAAADEGTRLYENARFIEPLTELISPFSPFEKIDVIYSKVIEIIEQFLKTETVSIWEKRTGPQTKKSEGEHRLEIRLKRVASSTGFGEGNAKINRQTLSYASFTGKALRTLDVCYANERQLRDRRKMVFAQFAKENGLRSLTSVPIRIGSEAYAAINIFSRRNTELFDEEKLILQILASKAAIALQSARLLSSFDRISEALLDGNVEETLKQITTSALDVLHAEPVILFRYDQNGRGFNPKAIIAGNLIHKNVHIVPNKNDIAMKVLDQGTVYVKNDKQYSEFEREVGRKWLSNRFDEDFFHREKIRSFAAVKLEHERETVGVMFFNYREQQEFSEPTVRLINGFASQASSAIYSARLTAQNKQFWETRRADSLSLAASEIISSLAHNAANVLNSINGWFGLLDETVKQSRSRSRSQKRVEQLLKKLKRPLGVLREDFSRLRDYQIVDELKIEPCEINKLISSSLFILSNRIKKQRVKVVLSLKTPSPVIQCDKLQTQHVILNLLLNALEAMREKGMLTVESVVDNKGGNLEIQISDTGAGIPKQIRPKIFELYYSTKTRKAGAGLGLPISRYILNRHRGRIDFATSKRGTTFTVYLPLIQGAADA